MIVDSCHCIFYFDRLYKYEDGGKCDGLLLRCGHCLPDCESTIYTSSVSATPLRRSIINKLGRWHWKILIRCDTKNIGLTMLCKFNGDVPLPAVWSHQVKCFLHQDRYFKYLVGRLNVACLKVLEEYKKSYQGEDLPDFLK